MTRETYRKAENLMRLIIAFEHEIDLFENDKKGPCSNSLPLNTSYLDKEIRAERNKVIVKEMKARLNKIEKEFAALK